MDSSQLRKRIKVDDCLNYRHRIKRFGSWITANLFPDYCLICEKLIEAGGFCQRCVKDLAHHKNQCRICAVPFSGNDICGQCQRKPPPYHRIIAPFRYTPPISDLIHQLKYRKMLHVGRILGELLSNHLHALDLGPVDALIPVPLHWRRQISRSFNQSNEISKQVSKRLGIPMDIKAVKRMRHTPPQVSLGPKQRKRNMHRAFMAKEISYSSVMIIDDVITSGSTVTELAKCLKRAGVEKVLVAAIARV